MDNPQSEAARVTRTLLPFALIIFFGYAAIGLPLATIPLLVHERLGFSTAIVGIVIGIAPAATLCTRQIAGRLADVRGPKFGLLIGLLTTATSGVFYFLALGLPSGPAIAVLLVGRVVLGLGDSLFTTALNLWMVNAAGPRHAGRAMSWAGIAMYAALAVGAPLGTVLYPHGFAWVALAVIVSPAIGIPIALARGKSPVTTAKPAAFFAVIGQMWPPGLGLVLASAGFGTIAAFLALRFAAMNWGGAGFALTGFGAVYIASRLLFAGLPDRLGGIRLATICLCTEAAGLLMIALAPSALVAGLGTALTGLGYSMVYPSLGVEVVRRVPPESRGVALSAYLACFDLGLGAAGPVMGVLAAGSSLPVAFSAAAVASLASLVLIRTTRNLGGIRPATAS